VAPGLDAAGLLQAAGQRGGRGALLATLIDELTVKETYFLRHQAELDTIDWKGLLAAATRRGEGRVRVWNPACATGEGPYSLAILALEALGAGAGASILATDIARPALRHAELAHYGGRALRHVTAPLRERHFRATGNGLTVAPHVRELVRFRAHNLASGTFPPPGEGRFDLVVLRNVLIYFDAPTVLGTLAGLRESLFPGGQLLLGAADRVTITAAQGRDSVAPVEARARRAPARARDRQPITAPGRASRLQPQAQAHVSEPKDPLDPCAHFLRGLSLRADGDIDAAVTALRHACYLDPAFARAAFELGRAHDALDDRPAARRSYQLALDALTGAGAHEQRLLEPAEIKAIAGASAHRLATLAEARRG
jgi:chemotaxis protein methyltransferase CheR